MSQPTMATRRSSAVSPTDFAHPYLHNPTQRPKKREFGLCNLFLFKVCGCFTGDELPPPNLEAPIYQAGKSSSSNFTFNTNTNTNTTPTTSRTHSPSKPATLSTTTTTTTATTATTATTTTATSRESGARHGFVGSTGVEDIPYRRPPPEQFQQPHHKTPYHASQVGRPASFSRIVPHSERVTAQSMARNRVSDAWESRAPVELAESEELETRKIVGNVSRLSAMFDQGE